MTKRSVQEKLLLPISPFFMWTSLIIALLLNMVPVGRVPWMPDLLALVIVFWSVHEPARIGMGVAFVFGLLVDVHQASLLGQHALSYTALGFFATAIHRRLQWLSLPAQALQVLPLFAVSHLIELAIRMMGGGVFPGWSLLIAPLIESVLWPLAGAILLAPQRRAPEPDANRPI
jgi:rod shape-determining protein MreD